MLCCYSTTEVRNISALMLPDDVGLTYTIIRMWVSLTPETYVRSSEPQMLRQHFTCGFGIIQLSSEEVAGLSCYRQIEKRLKSLERCQSLEEIQRLFESAEFDSVVRLLQPTLNYVSRSKTLEFVSSAPERPAQLILLQVRGAQKRSH